MASRARSVAGDTTGALAEALGPALEQVIAREVKGSGLFLPGARSGGGLGVCAGKLAGKLVPTIARLAPKILPALGLAAASGAISGSTHRAVAGSGVGAGEAHGMQHTAYHGYVHRGVALSMGQKESLARAVSEGASVTLRLGHGALEGPHVLLLTKTQVNRIMKKEAEGAGVDLTLSKTQIMAMKRAKAGGGPFLGALLAGVSAPLIGKVLGFGLPEKQGEGLFLPGTRRWGGSGEGLYLPGSR